MKKVSLIIFLLFCSSISYAEISIRLPNEALFKAAAAGDINFLKIWNYLKKDVNIRDRLGNTPLLIASENGNTAFIVALIEIGADINSSNDCGYTPLLAALFNNHFGSALLLESRGADKSIVNIYGTSPEIFLDTYDVTSVGDLMNLPENLDVEVRIGPNALLYMTNWQKAYYSAALNGRFDDAEDLLNVYAREGDPDASLIYANELVARGLYDEALKYYAYASDGGSAFASERVASILNSMGDTSAAYLYYCKASELGDYEAFAKCGAGLYLGAFGEVDYDTSLDYLLEAKRLGSYEAVYYLGLMKYYGRGLPSDKINGTADIQFAATNGIPEAVRQVKIFASEDTFSFLSKFRQAKRSYTRMYLLSQGALLIDRGNFCDTYNFDSYFAPDYGVEYIKLCYPEGREFTMEIGIAPSSDGYYKDYVIDFAYSVSALLKEVN